MPEPEYITPTTQHTAICSECGALVAREPNAMIPHGEFHEKLDELIDWAQSISKLFTGPQEEHHQHKGTPLQPNSGWD